MINLISDISNVQFKYLLKGLIQYSNCFQFIIREYNEKSGSVNRLLEKLAPFKQIEEEVREWPGTKLLGKSKATLFRYTLNDKSLAILIDINKGLYDWISPDLPEDLSFFDEGGGILFASITHESDAFVESKELYMRALFDELNLDYDIE